MRPTASAARMLLKVVVSTGLLIFLFKKISIEGFFGLVRGLDPFWIGAATAVFFVSNVLGSLQWHLLLSTSGVDISYGKSFRFYFIGLFFNNFLPANIGGDAVKIYDVSRLGSSVYQVTALTLLDRLIGIFSLCLLALAALCVVANIGDHGPVLVYGLMFLGCMAPLLVFYFVRPLGRILRWLVSHVRALSMDKRMTWILDHMGAFRARRRFVAKLTLLSVLIQFLRVLTHVLAALALGNRIDWVVFGLFFVYVPILSLAMIPPVTVNGLGVREGLGILLFSQAGIGRTDAFAIEFMTYLVSVLISLLGVVFFTLRRRAVAHPTPGTSII